MEVILPSSPGDQRADAAADDHPAQDQADGQRVEAWGQAAIQSVVTTAIAHADHAVAVARLAGDQVEDCGDIRVHGVPEPAATSTFFLYIASIRWVTRKPPKMFTAARAAAIAPAPLETRGPARQLARRPLAAAASRAPTMITDEMALVTAISGVCRAGVTDQTT
jgi:hypothetical protein